MKNRKALLAIIGVVAVIIAVLIFRFFQDRGPQKTEECKIGAVLLLSGDNALWGQNARKAIEMLSDDINAGGGINGKPLRVIFEDSKGDPKTAVSAFRKLVDVHRVPVVLGDMLSSTTLAMAPLANQYATVLLGISCSSPAISHAGPFVYRVWPSDEYEGRVFAEWLFNSGYNNVAIAYLDNDYGIGLKEAFKTRFSGLGGKVVAQEAYDASDRDFRHIVSKLAQAGAQVIYVVGYYEDTARMVKQLREAGVRAKIAGTSSAVHQRLFEIAGKAAEGFIAAVVNDFDLENLSPGQKKFLDSFRARYGEDPDWAATHGADALLVAVSCLRQQGCTNGEAIKNCIDTQRSFVAVNSGVVFDENGDVVSKPIAIKEVRGQKFVTIGKEKSREESSSGSDKETGHD